MNNHINDLKKVTRRLLEKARDLEFGKKVNRILSLDKGGSPLMLEHLNSLKGLFLCALATATDPLISSQKDRFLTNLDRLIQEVGVRIAADPSRKKISRIYVTALLKSHRSLFEGLQSSKTGIKHCPADYSKAVNSAVLIWGNQI